MSFKRWPVWSITVALVISALAVSLSCSDGDSDPGATGTTEAEDIDEVIAELVLAAADPAVEDITVTSKSEFTDSDGTMWLRFHITPLPEGVTDPAYGVLKRTPDGDWELVGLGTCCLEEDLPAEVRTGLGF